MSALHSKQTVAQGIHGIVALEFADAAARAAGTVSNPVAYVMTAADIGKVGKQTDNDTHYILTGFGPLVWTQIDAGAGGVVPPSRLITAGAGLTGGGDLSADRTLDVVANADGSLVVNANDIQVGVLASDAQHGTRGGGTQHAAATGAVAGFMSAADKTKLDTVRASATSALLHFGNSSVSSTTTSRYMTPGYEDGLAGTAVVQYYAPFAGNLKNLWVRHNTPAGNGNPIVYTIRINGAASALTCSVFSTASNGSDTTHTVAVAAGDRIDLQATKAAGIGSSPNEVLASVELSALS